MLKKRVAFIDTTWNNTKDGKYSGVGYYRVILPARFIKKYDVSVYGKNIHDLGATEEDIFKNLFLNHDAVVTKAVDNPKAASALCFFAQHYKKPLIIDLDDNYFEVRPDQPSYKFYHPGSQKTGILKAYLSLATHLVCSTNPLAKWHEKWFKKEAKLTRKVDVIPNCSCLADFNYSYKGNKDKSVVRIGWQGSMTHYADLKMVLPALREVINKYPHVRIELMGGLVLDEAAELFKEWTEKEFKNVLITAGTKSWESYPKKLSTKKWDIGICPLVDDEFNRNKSHIKWMEYSAYKIPTVASKVYPYFKDIDGVKTIQDGKTGFLASTTEEWVSYLSQLIESKKLRQKIGNNAHEFIKEHWQIEQHISKWEKVLDKFIK